MASRTVARTFAASRWRSSTASGASRISKATPAASPRRCFAPGEEAVVLEPGLAVAKWLAGHVEDVAAGGFEHRLAGGGVPLHRRAEARVEIRLAPRQNAEFEGAAAFQPFEHAPVLEILCETAAVLVAAAVDDDNSVRRRRARPDRLEGPARPPPHRGAGTVRGVGQPDSRAMHDAEHRTSILD